MKILKNHCHCCFFLLLGLTMRKSYYGNLQLFSELFECSQS